MKMSKMFLALVTFALLSGPLSAHTNIIYDWTGTCVTGCLSQATMHAELTDAYTPGQQFSEFQHPNQKDPPVLLALRSRTAT